MGFWLGILLGLLTALATFESLSLLVVSTLELFFVPTVVILFGFGASANLSVLALHGLLLTALLRAFLTCQHEVWLGDWLGIKDLLVELVGLQRLLWLARPRELGQDRDGSGQFRRLLEWDQSAFEPVRAVEVRCPSTGQKYLLRVPPSVQSCHEAVAWTFQLHSQVYAPAQES